MAITMVAAAEAVILLLIIMLVKKLGKKKTKKNPPGPKGVPVVGNLLQFDATKPLIYLQKLSRDYGPLVYLNHASTPTLLLSSSRLANQILKTHDLSFCTRPPVLGQQKLSYKGADMAFSPYNPHWKDMRRMCMLHLFSPKRVLSFRPIREAQVARIISKISAHASSSQLVNLSDIAMSLASNIVCGVAFGRTFEDHEFQKKRLDNMVIEAQALMVKFYFSDHFPALSWVDKVSGLLGRLDKNFKEMDTFYQELIDEHLNSLTPPEPDREDIIDLMIQLKRENPDSITWDHVKALLMNLFIAGTDTAAAGVVWTMTALMLKPAVMKKAQALIRQTIGDKGIIDEDDIEKLPYLKAVVLEGLRLYPPAPLLYRTPVDQENSIEIDGYEIKPGSTLIINGWAIARDPETWEDPEEFMPERFLNSDGSGIRQQVEMEMIPFGGGRRRCPGGGMGLVSIELALANLLYSFDWTPAAAVDVESLPGLTMHKKNPLMLMPIQYLHSNVN